MREAHSQQQNGIRENVTASPAREGELCIESSVVVDHSAPVERMATSTTTRRPARRERQRSEL